MHVCLVYDCLFPYTVGGAERWYRNLALRLAAAGHDVTYLTMRQWDRGDSTDLPGVSVVSVAPRMGLYSGGRRRILPPLGFGFGVLRHLAVHGSRYDVVHTASFPYFSVLACAAARRRGFRLVIDWHEVWTRRYWLDYLGPVGGRIGWSVQAACARVRHQAFCFSRLHARRLREIGFRGEPLVLEGEYDASSSTLAETRSGDESEREPFVLFAGRHIPEKRAPALVDAIARARERAPKLRCEILGDGPERDEVLRRIAAHRVENAVDAPGFVPTEQVANRLARALCLVLPSRREGYGLIVVEAAAAGTPSVVVADPDNAATELVEEGQNGFVADSADPEVLAEAILRVLDAGPALRSSTRRWFEANRGRLSIERSLDRVVAAYGGQN